MHFLPMLRFSGAGRYDAFPRLVLFAMCLIFGGGSVVQGQEPTANAPLPAQRLTQSGVTEFQNKINDLSRQFSAAFVVEGFPLRRNPPKEDAGIPVAGVPQSVVDLAESYDYDVAKSDTLFVFRKRYTQPDDVPLVTLGECRAALRDGVQLLSRFADVPPMQPNLGPVTTLAYYEDGTKEKFLSSFSVSQWNQIARPGGLRLDELQGIQQQNVIKFAATRRFHWTILNTLGTTQLLELMQERKPTLGFRNGETMFDRTAQLKGVPLFGYEAPYGAKHILAFRPISHPHVVESNATHVGASTETDSRDPTKVVNLGKDETAPNAQDFAWAQVEKSSPTVYLSEAINRLNERRVTSKEADFFPYTVDTALAEKPVFMVGEDKATPYAILHGIAAVYGLRVVKNDKGEERITRLRATIPRNLLELPSAMQASLPLPLQKVLQSQQKTQKFTYDSGTSIDRNSDMLFHIATVKHLRAATEPIIKAAKDGKVPLSELGPEASRDLAVSLLTTDYLQTIREMRTNHFPVYLNDLNRVALSGKRTEQADGSVMVSLSVCEVDKDGLLVPRSILPNYLFLPGQTSVGAK